MAVGEDEVCEVHLRRWKHLRGVARPEPVRIQLTVSVGGVCYPFAPCRRLPLQLVRIGEKGGAGMARRTAVPYRHSASVCRVWQCARKRVMTYMLTSSPHNH
eukprot:COSAG01_NODE_1492_length_10127_cov_55.322996_4_plen_102_part_00